MRLRHWSSVALVAILAVVLVASAQADSRSYWNTISITFRSVPAGDSFSGRVRSAKPACRRGRKVVIFRKRSGADERIRAARSRRGGRWEAIPPGGKAGAGHYYALMRRKVLSTGAEYRECAPVTTSDVEVKRH